MSFQYCPFHADEAVQGAPVGDEARSEAFECQRSAGHPTSGPHAWSWAPEPPGAEGVGGLAAELSLDFELPNAIASYNGRWVEYGLVERAYAIARPNDFARLLKLYGHTVLDEKVASKTIGGRQYTVSAYLARTLGDLSRHGAVLFRQGKGTGRWSYNEGISYWAVGPESPEWDDRLTWDAAAVDVDYVSSSLSS